MAHEFGRINVAREALIDVRFNGTETAECVIDTGFDGGVLLPKSLASRLQIPILGELTCELLGGTTMIAAVGLADIEWLGRSPLVEVVN